MEERKKRKKRVLCATVIGFFLLFLYAVFYAVTGLAVPCVFHLLTGWKCPGCGISTFSIYFLQGRFLEAIRQNYLAPVLYLYMVWAGVCFCRDYIRTGKKQVIVKPEIISWIFLGILAGWGILRNLQGFFAVDFPFHLCYTI